MYSVKRALQKAINAGVMGCNSDNFWDIGAEMDRQFLTTNKNKKETITMEELQKMFYRASDKQAKAIDKYLE